MITLEEIQERIIIVLNNSTLTQSEIARELNLTPSAISRMKKGEILPSVETLAKLCKLLNVATNYILCLDKYR